MRPLTLLIVMLMFLSMQANASFPNICHSTEQNVKAQYTIETHTHVGEKNQQLFTLWRTLKKVAHQYPLKNVTQQWTRAQNGRLTRTQFFDQYLHAIEFETQSPQKSTDNHWQKKFQLVTHQLINKMNLEGSQGELCDLVEYYQLEENGVIHQLSWLPNKKLVSRYRVSSAKLSKEWVLQSVDYDNNKVSDFFNIRDQYLNTDFADIGDNESDPVLSKLIHLGFSH